MNFPEVDIKSLRDQFMCANYLSAAQLYLRDNFLLSEKLKKDHIKRRQLGHWGSVPGTTFIYTCLNYLICQKAPEMIFMLGPGHAAPAVFSQLFLEGALEEYFPGYTRDNAGVAKLIKEFSWPDGFPSHVNPGTPGAILEGGELGYSLATAYGAVLDNPDLIVACVIGDGEAETGPLATAWQSNKFMNPAENGAVLPIVNVNGYKISQPTIYGAMDDEELRQMFTGMGYNPKFVDTTKSDSNGFKEMLTAIFESYEEILKIQKEAREDGKLLKPRWPMIVMRSLKGWTGVKEFKGSKIEGNYLSHGVPILDPHKDDDKFAAVEKWLSSYEPNKLFTDTGKPSESVMKFVPKKKLAMGFSKYVNSPDLYQDLSLPKLEKYEFIIEEKGKAKGQNTHELGKFLRDIFVLNEDAKNFRFFCPDETTSNKLDAMFEVTSRAFVWPLQKHDDKMAPDGRVMEMLSEHTLQAWMQGYLLTGRHGMLASYEAFIQIISSMVDQHAKFLKQAENFDWRPDIASANYLLSSLGWRQEHNGFSHQNPGFISNMLDKYGEFISVYFPPDVNSTLVIAEDCLERKNSVNIIVAGKRKLPQWLTMKEAKKQLLAGLMEWEFIGNRRYQPDVVMAACGDYATLETIAAIQLLTELAPQLATRFVSVSELTCLGLGDERHPCTIGTTLFNEYFTEDRPIVFNFHGYPIAVRKLMIGHPASERLVVHGYIDEGSTTTPFDMQIVNKTSRYHLAISALCQAKRSNPSLEVDIDGLVEHLQQKIKLHREYICATGEDPKEIVEWKWRG